MEAVMLSSVKGTLNKYVDFSGVASRSEYWTFYLFYTVTFFVASFLDGFFGLGFLTGIVFLGLVLPLLSCSARRMHDVGKSGWFQIIPLYNLFLFVQPSKPISLE
jgi:uncharacterized membrane protein YhaH (DUF805 family)